MNGLVGLKFYLHFLNIFICICTYTLPLLDYLFMYVRAMCVCTYDVYVRRSCVYVRMMCVCGHVCVLMCVWLMCVCGFSHGLMYFLLI